MADLARTFNSEAEQVAADRRARVASAVNQQEWLDREEIKWIPQKYRPGIMHGEEAVEEAQGDEEQALTYLMGDKEEEAQPPAHVKVATNQANQATPRSGYTKAVVIFAAFLLGSVYFFWDSMHQHTDPHRPLLVPAAGYHGVPLPGADPTSAFPDPSTGPDPAALSLDPSLGVPGMIGTMPVQNQNFGGDQNFGG